MTSLYERMKARGCDMSWYENSPNHKADATPLFDEECAKSLSVYLLKQDGTLWTVTIKGEPHKKVRTTGKTIEQPIYLCMATRTQYASFEQAREHNNCKQEPSR